VVYEIVRLLTAPMTIILFRTRRIAVANVPAHGPLILAANHFSDADHFFIACLLRRRVSFMGKSQLFSGALGWVLSRGGVFPVRRGHRDEEAFITARAILDAGGCIAIYPEGGRSRSGHLAETARPGVGRLALETGAAVVPVAVHGSQHLRNWKRLEFPRVVVRFGRPMRWPREEAPARERQQEVADRVFAEIRALYEELDSLGEREVRRRERVR
jgi:1-acyl-sn-glycerol-3-phosphate acyltransferase